MVRRSHQLQRFVVDELSTEYLCAMHHLLGWLERMKEKYMQTQNSAVSAVQFALETDDGLAFLRCWNEGNFEAIRREWPEAPVSVFVGADPLHPATPTKTKN